MNKLLSIIFLVTSTIVFGQETDENTPLSTYQQKAFMAVDLPAEFPGGSIAEQKYLNQHLKLPDTVGEVNGKVFFEFIVEKDGQISNIRLVQGIRPAVDSAAMDVIRNMPKWEPAYKNDMIVRQFMQYSIAVSRIRRK